MQDLYLTINFDIQSLQKIIGVINMTSIFKIERGGGINILEQLFGKIFVCLLIAFSFSKYCTYTQGSKAFLHCSFLLYNPLQTFCFKNFTKCL